MRVYRSWTDIHVLQMDLALLKDQIGKDIVLNLHPILQYSHGVLFAINMFLTNAAELIHHHQCVRGRTKHWNEIQI